MRTVDMKVWLSTMVIFSSLLRLVSHHIIPFWNFSKLISPEPKLIPSWFCVQNFLIFSRICGNFFQRKKSVQITEIIIVRYFSNFKLLIDKKIQTNFFRKLKFKTNNLVFYFYRYDCPILRYRRLKNTRFKKLLFFYY